MKIKRIIQVALLLFISVSIIYLVTEEVQRPVRAAAQSVPQEETARPAKVVVYYFHGNFRCVSCRKLEAVSREAVMNGFGEELKRGDLEWRTVNVEANGNEHFLSDYRLFSKSLVVVKFKYGQQTEYKNLAKSWELLGDDEALKQYVVSEVRGYLPAS